MVIMATTGAMLFIAATLLAKPYESSSRTSHAGNKIEHGDVACLLCTDHGPISLAEASRR